ACHAMPAPANSERQLVVSCDQHCFGHVAGPGTPGHQTRVLTDHAIPQPGSRPIAGIAGMDQISPQFACQALCIDHADAPGCSLQSLTHIAPLRADCFSRPQGSPGAKCDPSWRIRSVAARPDASLPWLLAVLQLKPGYVPAG